MAEVQVQVQLPQKKYDLKYTSKQDPSQLQQRRIQELQDRERQYARQEYYTRKSPQSSYTPAAKAAPLDPATTPLTVPDDLRAPLFTGSLGGLWQGSGGGLAGTGTLHLSKVMPPASQQTATASSTTSSATSIPTPTPTPTFNPTPPLTLTATGSTPIPTLPPVSATPTASSLTSLTTPLAAPCSSSATTVAPTVAPKLPVLPQAKVEYAHWPLASTSDVFSKSSKEISKILEKFYWPPEMVNKFLEFGTAIRKPRGKLRDVRKQFPMEEIREEEDRVTWESQKLGKFLSAVRTDTVCMHPFERKYSQKKDVTKDQKSFNPPSSPSASSSSASPAHKQSGEFPSLGAGHFGEVFLVDYDCNKSAKERIVLLDPSSPEAAKKMEEGKVSVLKFLNQRYSETEDFRPYFSFLMEGLICLIINTACPDVAIEWLDICKAFPGSAVATATATGTGTGAPRGMTPYGGMEMGMGMGVSMDIGIEGTSFSVPRSPPDIGLVMEYMPQTLNYFLWDDPDSADPATLYVMLFHIADHLEKLQRYFELEHKDFRSRNILYRKRKEDAKLTALDQGVRSPFDVKISDFGRASLLWGGVEWSCVPESAYQHYTAHSDQSERSSGSSSYGRGVGMGGGSSQRDGIGVGKSRRRPLDPSYDLAVLFAEIYLELRGRHPSLDAREHKTPGDKKRIQDKLAFLCPLLQYDILAGINLDNLQDQWHNVGGRRVQLKPLQYIEAQIRRRPKEKAKFSTPGYVKTKLREEIIKASKS